MDGTFAEITQAYRYISQALGIMLTEKGLTEDEAKEYLKKLIEEAMEMTCEKCEITTTKKEK